MADSRDKPELETLNYRCECADCNLPEPTSAPTMGFNSHVIKPETRVNKGEVAEQRFKASYKTNIGTEDKPDYRATEQPNPNPNLMIIEEIEGLLSQVNEKLYELPVFHITNSTGNELLKLQRQALEEIDLFQKTTLRKLKQEFE